MPEKYSKRLVLKSQKRNAAAVGFAAMPLMQVHNLPMCALTPIQFLLPTLIAHITARPRETYPQKESIFLSE